MLAERRLLSASRGIRGGNTWWLADFCIRGLYRHHSQGMHSYQDLQRGMMMRFFATAALAVMTLCAPNAAFSQTAKPFTDTELNLTFDALGEMWLDDEVSGNVNIREYIFDSGDEITIEYLPKGRVFANSAKARLEGIVAKTKDELKSSTVKIAVAPLAEYQGELSQRYDAIHSTGNEYYFVVATKTMLIIMTTMNATRADDFFNSLKIK